MVISPRCPECDAPTLHFRNVPCHRCERAWAWLHTDLDEQLRASWERTREECRERLGHTAYTDLWLSGLAIVSWENRVLTLAGWRHWTRWVSRRYPELLMAVVKTDKEPVFVTPRVGASIARRQQINREKEQR